LAANWLSRSTIRLSVSQRRHLSELSDQLARQVAESVSREAGLHISYEMNEALDERYVSEVGESIREECRRLLADAPLPE
jgi:ABC-type ATPase with predicted acetyltransferase domain